MSGTQNIQMMRYAIQALLLAPFLLVLSTVFITNRELAYGVITGKYFWFYAAMGLASVTVLLSIIIHKQNLHFSFLDGLIAVFCVCGLALTYYHTGEITTKWVLLLLLLILYSYFRILFAQNRWNLPVLMLFLVLTGLVEAVWGLCQLYGFTFSQHSLFKTTGSFFNPGPYAGYLALIFPLALYYATPKSPKGDLERKIVRCTAPKSPLGDLGVRITGIVTCVAILLVLPATMSRASWLAAVTGSLIVIIPYFEKHLGIFKKWRFKTILISIAVILLVLSVTLLGMYRLKKDSADGRTLMWKVTLQAISKHPFGVGLGNFPGVYASEQAVYFASGRATEAEESVAGSPEYGFNEYLQICLEWGVIPFVLFLSIIAGSLYTAYQRKQWEILAIFVSLLVFAFMSYPFSLLPFPVVLVFFLATIPPSPLKGELEGKTVHCAAPKSPLGDLGVIICFLLTAFCLYKAYPAYQAYKQWNLTQMQYQAKAYTAAKKEYEQLYPQLNDQIHFLFEYGHSLSCTGDYEKSNQILQRVSRISGDPMIYNIMGKNYQALKEYEQAEVCFVHAAQMIPNRLYPWYLLCKLYAEMNLFDKVKETAEIVQTKEPKVQSTAVREMREEVEKLRTKN